MELSNCSVIFSEFFSTKQNTDQDTIERMEQELAVEKEDDIDCFTCNYTVGDADNVALTTPQKSKQMSFLEWDLAGEKEDQTDCFKCEFTSDDADNVTMQTPQQSKQKVIKMYVLKQKWDNAKIIHYFFHRPQ